MLTTGYPGCWGGCNTANTALANTGQMVDVWITTKGANMSDKLYINQQRKHLSTGLQIDAFFTQVGAVCVCLCIVQALVVMAM